MASTSVRSMAMPAGIGFAGRARLRELLARAAVDELQFARHRVGCVFRFDRARIGRVDEDQPPLRVARPDRSGQRIERRPHGGDVAGELVVAGGKIDQLARDAADVAQAQHRAPADGAAFRLDRATAQAGERHGEAAALAAQRLDRLLHGLRRRRLQPAAEGQHAFRHAAAGQERGVAEDVGPVAGRRRFHQHLRLGQQQRA
jgi:hypothetical protein